MGAAVQHDNDTSCRQRQFGSLDGSTGHVLKLVAGRHELSSTSGKDRLMEILFILVPTSVVLMGVAMWVFVQAVDSGQFDDLDQHALDIFDNDEVQDNEHIGE